MKAEELIKILEHADSAMEEFKAEKGMAERDGEWNGVNLALDAVREYVKCSLISDTKGEAGKHVLNYEFDAGEGGNLFWISSENDTYAYGPYWTIEEAKAAADKLGLDLEPLDADCYSAERENLNR